MIVGRVMTPRTSPGVGRQCCVLACLCLLFAALSGQFVLRVHGDNESGASAATAVEAEAEVEETMQKILLNRERPARIGDVRALIFIKQLKVGGSTVAGIVRQIMWERFHVNCTPPAHSQFTFVPEDGEDLFNMLEVSAASSSPPEHSCFANHGARRHIYPIDVTGKRHIWGIPKIAKTILEKEFVPTQDHGEFLMTIVRDPTQRLFSYLHFRARKLYNAAHSNDGDQKPSFTVDADYSEFLPKTNIELCELLQQDFTFSPQFTYLKPFIDRMEKKQLHKYVLSRKQPDTDLDACESLRLKYTVHGQDDAEWVADNYDLLLVTDRLDESLVVLKNMLQLSFRDIAYVPMKVSAPQRSLSTDALDNGLLLGKHDHLQQYSNGTGVRDARMLFSPDRYSTEPLFEAAKKIMEGTGDLALYTVVHERLNAHIARIGIAKFKAELAKFQQIQKAIQEHCAVWHGESVDELNRRSGPEWCYFNAGGLEHNGNGCAYPCINDFFHTHSQVN